MMTTWTLTVLLKWMIKLVISNWSFEGCKDAYFGPVWQNTSKMQRIDVFLKYNIPTHILAHMLE